MMPRFSAEKSLERSRTYYSGRVRNPVPSGSILPQLMPVFGGETYYCSWDGGNLICGEFPFGGGVSFGGGSVGGGVPDPTCVQCRAACLRKPAARRAACLAQCDDLFC